MHLSAASHASPLMRRAALHASRWRLVLTENLAHHIYICAEPTPDNATSLFITLLPFLLKG